MATTKIWAIKDSLSRVVSYAENPNKTSLSELKQVLKYAENDEKTVDENDKTMYHLGEEYLPQNIAKTVENNPYYYQNRYLKFTKTKKKNKYKTYRLRG